MEIPGTRIIAISEKEDEKCFPWLWRALAVPRVAFVGDGSVVTGAY